jgi:hypothetical protein
VLRFFGGALLARYAASGARRLSKGETMPQNPPIIAGTRIGHVHLKVADLEREAIDLSACGTMDCSSLRSSQ